MACHIRWIFLLDVESATCPSHHWGVFSAVRTSGCPMFGSGVYNGVKHNNITTPFAQQKLMAYMNICEADSVFFWSLCVVDKMPPGLAVPIDPSGPPQMKWGGNFFQGKTKWEGVVLPRALSVNAMVTIVTRYPDVMLQTLQSPLVATRWCGHWTVTRPVSSTFHIFCLKTIALVDCVSQHLLCWSLFVCANLLPEALLFGFCVWSWCWWTSLLLPCQLSHFLGMGNP